MARYCVGEDELGPGHIIVSGPYTSPDGCLGGCDGENSLLVNGNFNSPAPSTCAGLQVDPLRSLAAPPWDIGLNCDAYIYCDASVPGYQANRFIGLGFGVNLGAVQQAVYTTPGSSYSVSFDMGNQPGYNSGLEIAESRFLEVVVYGLTPTEMDNLQNWTGPSDPTLEFFQVIYQTNFSIPKMNVPNTYDLGWQNKMFSFSATTSATLLRFRTMDTRVGSPSNQEAGVVLDNVTMQLDG